MSLQILKFGLKNAFRKKSIAILSILGIAIGIGMMVVLSAATEGMDQMMVNMLADTVGDIEVIEYNKPTSLSQLPSNISDIIRTIESEDSIEQISPEIEVSGFQQFAEELSLPPSLQMLRARGVHSEFDEVFGGPTANIYEGKIFENDFEVIVAEFLNDNNPDYASVGKELVFQVNATYSVNLTIVGIFSTDIGPAKFLNPSFMMTIETAKIINELYMGLTFDGYSLARIRFDTEDIEETKLFAEELEELSPKLTTTLLGDGAETAGTLLDTFHTFSIVVSIVAVVAGGMSIIVAQLMGVSERMKEFAIMKATGWKNRAIFLDIIFESILLGVIGAIVGFALGTALMYTVQAVADQVFIVLTWEIALVVLGFGFGIGLIGGLIPGIKASKIKPMEVIRGL